MNARPVDRLPCTCETPRIPAPTFADPDATVLGGTRLDADCPRHRAEVVAAVFPWPCDRRDAHGPHHVDHGSGGGTAHPQVYEPGVFDCPGVGAHPATMIGRAS